MWLSLMVFDFCVIIINIIILTIIIIFKFKIKIFSATQYNNKWWHYLPFTLSLWAQATHADTCTGHGVDVRQITCSAPPWGRCQEDGRPWLCAGRPVSWWDTLALRGQAMPWTGTVEPLSSHWSRSVQFNTSMTERGAVPPRPFPTRYCGDAEVTLQSHQMSDELFLNGDSCSGTEVKWLKYKKVKKSCKNMLPCSPKTRFSNSVQSSILRYLHQHQ